MKSKIYPICEVCDNPITNSDCGYIVVGNIGVADAENFGGLIGNSFPEPSEDGTIMLADVQSTVYCRSCFCKILNINQTYSR